MEVILLEKIANLGALGDRVTVKGLWAKLLDLQAKAVAATADNVEAFESRRAELKKRRPKSCRPLRLVQQRGGARTHDIANAGEEGKLFGSVGAREIRPLQQTRGGIGS